MRQRLMSIAPKSERWHPRPGIGRPETRRPGPMSLRGRTPTALKTADDYGLKSMRPRETRPRSELANQADAVGSYPLYERCGIEIERCGRRRCPLEWPSRSSRRCTERETERE